VEVKIVMFHLELIVRLKHKVDFKDNEHYMYSGVCKICCHLHVIVLIVMMFILNSHFCALGCGNKLL